jgi:excisionase family DNA binding protein
MNAHLEHADAVPPTQRDAELAALASCALAARHEPDGNLRIYLEDGESFLLPEVAARLLARLLAELGQGNAVALIPVEAELTTQQAADFLNVSRPHLVRLLEDRKIPFHKVGTHRRVKFADLANYKKQFEERRRAAVDELAAQGQELEMGY